MLFNDVAASRLKGYIQSCTDKRVVPPLGYLTDAMETLYPKAVVIQIAHPIPPPKEPNKVRLRQVPISHPSPHKARSNLDLITHQVPFVMIVFTSSGSRGNIFAQDVFEKMQ